MASLASAQDTKAEALIDEITPVLDHYWDTGQIPDDLDEEWLDQMIALTTQASVCEAKDIIENRVHINRKN